jgi:hypothetical protein
LPKQNDRLLWQRSSSATHHWQLATQSAAEREKAVSKIAKLWKSIFKIDLLSRDM